MIYAVEANTITEINVDVDTPEPLKSLDNEISSDTDGISIEKFNWDKNDDSAKFNETYTISIELKVQEGFKL